MTVEAYQCEFLNLSRYAEDEITTDARKQQKFRRGLNSDLKLALAVHDFANFATMVNKAISVETAHMEHRDSLKRHRDVGSSSSATQKRRIWIPNSVAKPAPPVPRPSYAAPVCLRHHQGQELCHRQPMLPLSVLKMGCASSAIS